MTDLLIVSVCLFLSRDCVLNAQVWEEALNSLAVELVEECVCEDVRGVGDETLQQLKQEKKDMLEAVKREFLLLRTQKYWNRLASLCLNYVWI